ncbi:MAG: Ig-like domain-containing protein, partial [Planctomycetota bacterium]
ESIGGVNLVVNRVASSTFDQRTFTISSDIVDEAGPMLTQITPADGATAHLTTAGITLVFSEELDPRTVRTTNVALLAGETPVGAAIWIEDDLKTVHLVPHTELSASTTYTVSIGAGLTDLCGNAFGAASTIFGTGTGGDQTAPSIDLVSVEGIPAAFDGSGTYVNAAGQGGNGFDLFLPQNGFLLRAEFSDQGGAGIDPATFSVKCNRAIGSTAASAELASNFTLTQTYAEWRIPATSEIDAADNVTFTFLVNDRAGNPATAKVITVDVLGRGMSSMAGTGDLDPFPARETWILRFDLDHYSHTWSTQASPAKQGTATTNVANATVDFAEALRVVGLQSPNMTTAAAGTWNGFTIGTNAILQRLVAERVREILRMRFGIGADGTHGTDAPDVEFLLAGEQGSLGSMPVLSTSASNNSGQAFSEISFGGTGGAESDPYVAGSMNGRGWYDTRNTTSQASLNTNGSAGVFVASMLKREVNGYPSRPFFGKISAKFVTIHGGTPVGEHASDDDVLADTFDRLTSTDTTHNVRYDEIMDAVELVALYLSATAAHEIGHSLGVVADGAPKTGQFGGAHHGNAFTDATSLNPNTSGHLSVAGLNNLMATGSNFSLMSRTGTEFQRFAPHVHAYLVRRVIYDEGR